MKWRDDLSVGSVAVDNQHKKLFEIIDNLMIACNEQRGKEEVGKTLAFLAEYTRIHFRDEEKLLLANNYPKYNQQKASHDKFTKDVQNAIVQYREQGANLTVLLGLLSKCNQWLLQHIMVMDKEYAKFFKEKNISI